MPGLKAAFAGVLGGLLLIIIFEVLIIFGLVPFEVIPVRRFLEQIGLEITVLAYLLGLLCGVFWSLVMVFILHNNTSWRWGFALGVIIWLGFIFVGAPLAGWGILGFEISGPAIEATGFLLFTLLAYILYGSFLGFLNNRWVYFDTGVEEEISNYRE